MNLVISIIWFWYMQIREIKCDEIYLEELLEKKQLKTGDLILFKAQNNLYATPMFNHFTHIGMVIVDPVLNNNEPYIFEAKGVRNIKIIKQRHTRGILFTPLKGVIEKYKGRVYYKSLSANINTDMHMKLVNFLFHALKNMKYEYNSPGSSLRKKLLGERCGNETNCGELIFLCLVNMGLLSINHWNMQVFHYLKWMCYIKKLKKNYKYLDIKKVLVTAY